MFFFCLSLFWCKRNLQTSNSTLHIKLHASHQTPRSLHTTSIKLATTPPPPQLPTTNEHRVVTFSTRDMEARHGRGAISRRNAGARGSNHGARVFPPFSPAYCLPRSDSRPTSPCTGWGRGDPSRGSKVGASFWGNDFPGSVPKLSPSSPMRGGVEGKREDTPPSSRFWMELEGGAEPRTGRAEGAEPRVIKWVCGQAEVAFCVGETAFGGSEPGVC